MHFIEAAQTAGLAGGIKYFKKLIVDKLGKETLYKYFSIFKDYGFKV